MVLPESDASIKRGRHGPLHFVVGAVHKGSDKEPHVENSIIRNIALTCKTGLQPSNLFR